MIIIIHNRLAMFLPVEIDSYEELFFKRWFPGIKQKYLEPMVMIGV